MNKIHVCIISKQPLPNLIPILQDKPDYVALIVSNEMVQEAASFRQTLKYCGYDNAAVFSYDGIPDSGLENLQFKALEIFEEQSQRTPDPHFFYNATGGNKIMAFAFASQFMESPHEVFYVDTAHGRLETLYPAATPVKGMEQILDIELYLKAYGETVRKIGSDEERWAGSVQHRKSLTYWTATNIRSLDKAIGCLNSAVSSAIATTGDRISDPLQKLPFVPKFEFLEYLKKLHDQGLIQWSEERSDQVYFHNLEGAFYVSGGWLEEYAWLVAKDLAIHSMGANVVLTDDLKAKSNIRNELDLVAVHNNRMIIVEVKTSRFGKNQQRDNEIVYKIDSLARKFGGLFCKRLLLSAIPLDHRTKKGREVNVSHRAASHDIEVLDGIRIIELKESLRRWMSVS